MTDIGYQQPLYPYTVGLNGTYPYGYGGYGYGYPGWGWGWGGGNVIIIKRGHGGHWNGGGGSSGGWHGGGGSSQQLRTAAVFGNHFSGQSNMVANPTSGQARVGGGGRR
jgi:hypothetical protein